MKFKFKGDISDVSLGIKELLPELNSEISEDGFEFEVIKTEKKGLEVDFNSNSGRIIYSSPCCFFRALGIAVQKHEEGEKTFHLKEDLYFDTNGPMFDVSQGNAAPNVKTMKHFIRQMALMGLNMLMIYCEDSFEVKEQPMFGYMRARYSEAEMKELDEYAYNLGIEMIPCIQTLAHMPDTLRWKCFRNITDYPECLLVNEDETYKFLEDIITAAARPFRTKKIHIGMDEAMKLGKGKYLDINGYEDPAVIMKKHLDRVMKIIDKLGLQPWMWSDMFFRSFGTRKYYQPDTPIPETVKQAVPKNMKVIYWDYYGLTPEKYENQLIKHRELTDNFAFAGGVWTWVGYSLSWSKTLKTTNIALNKCKEQNVRDVFITIWGDNGTECLMNTTLIGLQLFAEHGYNKELDYEEFKKRFKFITGGNVEDFEKLEYLDRTPNNEANIPGILEQDPSNYNSSKYLMWQDILTGLADKNIDGWELDAHYKKLEEELKACIGRNGQFDSMFDFSAAVAHVLSMKAQMGLRITKAYKQGDKALLKNFAENELPELRSRVVTLRKKHMENWFSIYKALGWDIIDMRYGSLITRIDSAIEEISFYLSGKFEKLEELEEERQYFDGKPGPIRYMNAYGRIASPSRIAPDA